LHDVSSFEKFILRTVLRFHSFENYYIIIQISY
jgi:hypothetical protein